jgi:UDP-GlcNAc:undecaprenyl-phosphate/decaprenyl-phosphate GlcNAc-1-phosphate transferase
VNSFLPFGLALGLAYVLVPWVRKLALAAGAIDRPGEARKVHTRPIPRWGGLAIYVAFIVVVLANFSISRQLLGLIAGTLILVVVGMIDDRSGLKPSTKLLWQLAAAGVALAGGIGITTLTNPFGGVIQLDFWKFPVELGPLRFHISPVANALSIVWMVGLINAINFLDGLDGLACGVSGIASLILFLVAVAPSVNQPEVALLAIILAGATLGFLPYNFYPAKIFMGDSGAYFLGLALALLSVYSGAKVATASLVLGFTIIDGLWAVVRRLLKRKSPFMADRGHLHHLLIDVGWSQRQAVLALYVLALVFGLAALVSGSMAKLIVMALLLLVTATLITSLMVVINRRSRVK